MRSQPCTACSANQYSGSQAAVCAACPANSFSAVNSSSCTCNAGFAANGTGAALVCTRAFVAT